MIPKKFLAWGGCAVALVLLAYPVLGAEPASGTPEAKPVKVDMKGSAFVPQAVVVQANLSVTWTNKDAFAHDVTSAPRGVLDSPRNMPQGATWTYNFTTPGVYDYYCTLHSTGPGNLMWGRVIVTPAPYLALAGAGAAAPDFNPEEIGVTWLAHWVGLASFLAVVATLLIYYFVLKYGESVHTTDHRDRKEK